MISQFISAVLNIKGSLLAQLFIGFLGAHASHLLHLGEAIVIVAQAWGMFLMYCALNTARINGQLAKAPMYVRAISYGLLIVMAVVDVAFNLTIGSLLFLELPNIKGKSYTFSSRCSDHYTDPGWRGRLSRWVCNDWLNPIAPGHCH